jgi:WD40 repeat protein
LDKSQGIFLWASLILARIEQLYTFEDKIAALKKVPSEMNGLYTGIMENIAKSPSADLAKHILEWVCCAPQPLSIAELCEAIRLDINQTLLSSSNDDTVSRICFNLVTVDSESRIQLMHQTVREFLTTADSGFHINTRSTHERLAEICLKHLCGPNFVPSPGGQRRHLASSSRATDSVFDEYACSSFAYHLDHSHSIAAPLFSSLVMFLNTNSVSWIDRVAKKGKLVPLITTIQHIKPYLARQLETGPPFSKEYRTLDSWVGDLTRVVTIFGPYLIDVPSSIYTLVPSLCPRRSVIHETFAAKSKHKVICTSNNEWEERLACLLFPTASKSIAINPRHLAVGLKDGTIRLFDASTLERVTTLNHGEKEPVRVLEFGRVSKRFVSCSPQTLTLWGEGFKRQWTAKLPGGASRPTLIRFSADDSKIFVTMKDRAAWVRVFRTSDGVELPPVSINNANHGFSDSDSDKSIPAQAREQERYIFQLMVIDPVLGFAAVARRSSHLELYEMDAEGENLNKLCRFIKEGAEHSELPPQVLDVAFNPAVGLDLFAVSYQGGDIVTVEIDGWGNAIQRNRHSLLATYLTSSPDGRTLAAGEHDYGISLFTFETLTLIHRIPALEQITDAIVFASNSLRLYDIRVQSCNVWEPSVLVRKSSLDDNSSNPSDPDETVLNEPHAITTDYAGDDRYITAMSQASDDKNYPFIFCGREDGTITVHRFTDGVEVLDWTCHAAEVSHVDWNRNAQMVLSVDVSGRCVATILAMPQTLDGPWKRVQRLLDIRLTTVVQQALLRPDGGAILVSCIDGETLWERQSGTINTSQHAPLDDTSTQPTAQEKARWILHPTDTSRLLLIDGLTIHIFLWTGLTRETAPSGITMTIPPLPPSIAAPLPLTNDWTHRTGIPSLTQAVQLDSLSSACFLTIDTNRLQTTTNTTTMTNICIKLIMRKMSLSSVKMVLGLHKTNLFFLSQRGWICSLTMGDKLATAKTYTRHFFIPPFWRTGADESMVRVVSRSSVVLAHRDAVVVFHRFLDAEWKVEFEDC